jgi:hypothetical protein
VRPVATEVIPQHNANEEHLENRVENREPQQADVVAFREVQNLLAVVARSQVEDDHDNNQGREPRKKLPGVVHTPSLAERRS